jgi:O-antigen/teichoic acid export membrane protein
MVAVYSVRPGRRRKTNIGVRTITKLSGAGMKTAESTFKPAFMLMLGRLGAFTVTFISGPLLARIFSQSEFGTYKQFLLLVGTLYILGQLGFAESLYYFLPGNVQASGRYAFNSLLVLGSMGTLFALAIVVSPVWVANWLNNAELAQYLLLASVYLVFMMMGALLEITMICRKRYQLATASYVISDIFRVALLLVPALITHDLRWTFIGGIVFFTIRFLAMVWFFRTEFGADFRFDASLLRSQAAYALPFAASGVFFTIQHNYHQYAVSYHFDAATFAIYAVGCLQIPIVDFMATPASNVMMVQMRERLRRDQSVGLLDIWHDTSRKLALLFFPLVGLLAVNALPLITVLYTTAYAASAPIFAIWSLTILFAALQTDGVLRVFAQNRWLMLTHAVRLAAIVSFMGVFLSTFNIIGAVFLTLCGALLSKVMMLIRIKTLLQTKFVTLLPWKDLGFVLLTAMLAAVPSAIMNVKLDVPAFVLLPLAGMTYMVTYAVLVFGLGLVSDAEKTALKRSLYVWNRRTGESRNEASL